jgi:hypothetical protein
VSPPKALQSHDERSFRALETLRERVRTIDMKQMGVGLAAAVLIDATLIRAVLLPAAMKLLGEWNWYLPRWLEWLPVLSPEALPEETREERRAA